MRPSGISNIKIPVLYVNPYFNNDPQLIEEVTQAGGLGVVDHATVSRSTMRLSSGVTHGVRCYLKDLADYGSNSYIRVAIIPLIDVEDMNKGESLSLSKYPFPVFVEAGNADHAMIAEKAGAAGLIVRGSEGPGWVSDTNGFVLLQKILQSSKLPVFLQGGVSLRTAAGCVRAGASGVVLDNHLLLTESSSLSEKFKKFLSGLVLPATTVLGEGFSRNLRVYSRVGTKIVRELRKIEESLTPDELPSYFFRLNSSIGIPSETPDLDESLFALSEDIVAARTLAARYGSVSAIVEEFGRIMGQVQATWPFGQDCELSREHGTKHPIVQGPMAHVSDNADFLRLIAEGGALPFLALGNMPGPIAKKAMDEAREKTENLYGVGLIGLDVNALRYEAHLQLMSKNPPKFAILAAGGPDLARRIESLGVKCYLHCPAPAMLSDGLRAGLRRFVFEGNESGGHIGNMGSLTLWSYNLDELAKHADDGLDLSEVRVLFAGGIASPEAAAFVAGMVGDLTSRGLKAGLQMGTAYLTAQEAVSTEAITECYQRITIENAGTVVIGRTVNIKARAANSPMASTLIAKELERVRDGISLRERKELYETDNLGALRLAAKGCAIDPSTADSESPCFCELSQEDQISRGLYLMGQGVCLLSKKTTIEDIHKDILEKGRDIFETENHFYTEFQKSESSETSYENSQKGLYHSQTSPIAMKHDSTAITASLMPSSVGEPEFSERLEITENEETNEAELCYGPFDEPIAVVGMGLRLPGSDSPESFWKYIIEKRSGIVKAPVDRWRNIDYYYDPNPKVPDKTYSCIGGFITDFAFDPLKFRIPPSVAKKMDRTQKLAISCVADALEDAGLKPEQLKGMKVGIVIGNSMGGETTDRYAERLSLPRTLDMLSESFQKVGLDAAATQAAIEIFKQRYLEDLPEITEDSLPGELPNVISGRVANVFNLEGPNFTVDAACASSLAAVMNAVNGLRSGFMDIALAGGVDAAMHPSSFIKFCKVGALSSDGSRPFDARANGFIMGEGAGIMVMKRLSDAIKDRDRVYGVVLGVGSSSDGRGKGITAPNAAGQERAIKACLEAAQVEPRAIGLIEAHGTSTPVGDTTELILLDEFFRKAGAPVGSVGVGSVKSQIGHLKAGAGAAGLMKALLAVYNRTLPPTINIETPNPCINWQDSPLKLLTEAQPWKTVNGNPRRAGISAFGFGGTNFHVIIQEFYPNLRIVPKAVSRMKRSVPIEFVPPDWPKPANLKSDGEAWAVGANSPEELASKVKRILTELNAKTFNHLSTESRKNLGSFEVRFGFGATDFEMAAKKLETILEVIKDPSKKAILPARGISHAKGSQLRSKPGAAFLFPGQGSQYSYMFRDLVERYQVVSDTFVEADEILQSLGLPSIISTIFPDVSDENKSDSGAADPLRDTQILQPMILTADTAMLRLLETMSIKPVVCAGHSLGEYAACVAAGVFTFRDALEAVAVRGREMARVSIADPGLMMSIPADARAVEEILAEVDGYVVAANKNSPKQTVISGETQAVKKAAELFKAKGLEGILVPVSAAFHSGVVAPAREPFMKTLDKLRVNPPTTPIISNVTGDFYPVGPGASDRIRDLLGKQFAAPVEWVKTLRKMYSEGIRVFVECGPKRVMTNLTLDTLSSDALALPMNHPKKGGILQLMESLAALMVEGFDVRFDNSQGPSVTGLGGAQRTELKLVDSRDTVNSTVSRPESKPTEIAPSPLDSLIDDELKQIVTRKEFSRYVQIQGPSIRALLKTGYESFVETILPMEKVVQTMKSEGMNFDSVVISGCSAGLPSDVRFAFDRENLDDLILGKNFIKQVPETGRIDMLEKNVERLYKGPNGEADLRSVDDINGVIQLAGFFNDAEISKEYGLDEKLLAAMDVTTRLALAAGLEALKDAGIPLVRQMKITRAGTELPDAWALPAELRAETGIIFASAFPGMASLVDEVTRETAAKYGAGAKKRLIDFYTGLVERIRDDRERERVTKWFTQEFSKIAGSDDDELYTFNRTFLLRVMSMAHGQLAQFIKAQGPNTHVDAACAGTTQAILLGRDWIRTGQAKRVIVIAADDVAGKTLLPWIGSGFLSMGAATTNANLSEAALPFDDRRHGLILGSAAVGVVLEAEVLTKQRGMESIASIEAGVVANSGFHGTRLDIEHITSVMETMISKWEKQTGTSRDELAQKMFFMSHETYSPKRGGSADAEIKALRSTFGSRATQIPIANTKGFTGHTMGVGVEDVVSLRCLQKGLLPPIPNLKNPDPDFEDLNLSRGGKCNADYALRLAAGFGSQIVMSLYKVKSHEENRIVDLGSHREWLKRITGYNDPVITVEDRTLKVSQRSDSASLPGEIEKIAALEPSMAKSTISESSRHSNDQVRTQILSLLSEKTGYPAEMLDTGLDLEADLGIDTVKQAEFIAEVREKFAIPRIDGLKIAEFPTIEHIINFVLSHTAPQTDEKVQVILDQGQNRSDYSEIQDKILSLLSEKTGYPSDMLDVELDLEADLGIDTVKQAEFISEVREVFGIPRIDGLKIADFPTIKHIIGFVMERSQGTSERSEAVASETQTLDVSKKEPEIGLFEARLVELGEIDRIDPKKVNKFMVISKPCELADFVEKQLRSTGHTQINKIENVEELQRLAEEETGIINLLGVDASDDVDRKSFELFLEMAKLFEDGPASLVTVVKEDGAYGFRDPKDFGFRIGALTGAAKSFAREYPKTVSRVIDLNPSLEAARAAEIIVNSLATDCPLEIGTTSEGNLEVIRFFSVADDFKKSALKSGDVILATGGARGITAECVKRLAAHDTFTFILLGRTPHTDSSEKYANFNEEDWLRERNRIIDQMKRQGIATTPVKVEKALSEMKAEGEIFRNITEIRSLGSEVIYRSVDILDDASLDELIGDVASICGRVDMIIHGAGLDISKTLKSKTIEQIQLVYDVKVKGIQNLLESLEKHGLPPKRIIGFGSVAGRFGNLAQLDYSAANDSLAHLMRHISHKTDIRATVVDWAPWAEVGMAVRGSVQSTLENAGIDFIPPRAGAMLLEKEIYRHGFSPEVLVAGRLGPFRKDAFTSHGAKKFGAFEIGGQSAEVMELIPGEKIKVKIFLDPTHPLLDHHRIDRTAVFPGVGGLELMRRAYQLMKTDETIVNFSNVRYLRPLKVFRNDPFQAEIEVFCDSSSDSQNKTYKARITSVFMDKDGRELGEPRVHHECEITSTEEEILQWPDSQLWEQSVFVPHSEIYEQFFHGPAFRLIEYFSIHSSGKAVRFRYKDTTYRKQMFSDVIPAAVEAVFQAVAAYGMESHGVMSLPIGVDKLIIHKNDSLPNIGELTATEIFVGSPGEQRSRFKFDGWIRDHQGNVMVSLFGIQMIELEAKGKFVGKLHESAIEIGALFRDDDSLHSEKVLQFLTPEEIEEAKLKSTLKRQKEWLSGRIALKKSVGQLLAERGTNHAQASDIRIFQDNLGKPFAELITGDNATIGSLSLSHSNGLAMAAAAAAGNFWGLGIDVEKVEQRTESWVNDYFDESEIQLAENGPQKWLTLNSIWALKEAVLKALGVGLRYDLKDIVVTELDQFGKAKLEFRNELVKAINRMEFSESEAWVEFMDRMVIARAIIKN